MLRKARDEIKRKNLRYNFLLNSIIILLKIILFLNFIIFNLVQSQQFENIGPPGGPVKKIVINPVNTNIIYTIPHQGQALFKSVDGGLTSEALGGDTLSSALGHSLLLDPVDPNIVYSSSYKSTDEGITWKKIKYPPTIINPKNPNHYFMKGHSGKLYASYDGGETIILLYDFKTMNFGSLEISYSDTNILYAEAYDSITGYGVHKSTNSGVSFTKTKFIAKSSILDIAINPLNSDVVYVGTLSEGVYKTTDGGNTWQLVLSTYWVNDIEIHPDDTSLVYAVTGDYLYLEVGHVFKTTNGGRDWQILNAGLPKDINRFLYAVAINPHNKDEAYVGTYGFGVYKTTNGGMLWKQTKAMTIWGHVCQDPDSVDHIYSISSLAGVMKTTNDGKDWEIIDFGNIPTVMGGFFEIIFDPHNHNTMWLAGGMFGLLKSTDRGRTWQSTSMQGTFDTYIVKVAVNPSDSNMIYVGQTGWMSRNLYRSSDRGNTWIKIQLDAGDIVGINDIKFDPKNSNIIYVCTSDFGIFKSTNNGINWFQINDGLVRYDTLSNLFYRVTTIEIHPDSTSIIYTIQQASGQMRGHIFRSSSGGINWYLIDSNIVEMFGNYNPLDIKISKIDKNKIYAGIAQRDLTRSMLYPETGIFSTTNYGETWQKLPSCKIGYITFSLHNPRIMYITYSYGIQKYYDTLTSLVKLQLDSPPRFELSQNYPNPFNSSTVIKYTIKNKSKVNIKIYDLLGRVVKSYYMEHSGPGEYQITWNGTNEKGGELSSGVYFYCLEAEGFVKTRKLLLLR